MATAQRGIAAVPDEADVRGKRTAAYSQEELLDFYREMLLIRRFEEKAGQLYGMGLIGGFCHLYIGQEAVAVGMQHALNEGDSVITGLATARAEITGAGPGAGGRGQGGGRRGF